VKNDKREKIYGRENENPMGRMRSAIQKEKFRGSPEWFYGVFFFISIILLAIGIEKIKRNFFKVLL